MAVTRANNGLIDENKFKSIIPGRTKGEDPFCALREVRWVGLEPTRLSAHGPQPCLSTNSSTSARRFRGFGVL